MSVEVYGPRVYQPGGGRVMRSGVVQQSGRAVRDDGGAFFPLGLTFMWSLQGIKHEWEHYKANVEWAADKGFDFKRPLTEVSGAEHEGAWTGTRRLDPTSAEWADWHDVLRKDIDFSYELGVRSGITISGKGSGADRLWLAREVAGVIADGRTHKALCCEMQNESWNFGNSLDVLVGMAAEVKARIPNLLSLSAPENTNESISLTRAACQQAGVAIYNRHTERGGGDYGWRDVRQAYDFHADAPFIGADWEGPGPGSSGAQMTSPLQLAMKRILAAMNGAPIFILHTGTGVYGDGKPGSTGPRPPNFWEIPNIDAIVSAIRGVDVLLPPDLPNWRSGNAVGWPFQPHAFWEGDHGDGVNKAFSAQAPDGRVMQSMLGVRGHCRMTANFPVRDVTVYNPLTLQPVLPIRNYAQGESMELAGGGQDAMVAYVIHGKR